MVLVLVQECFRLRYIVLRNLHKTMTATLRARNARISQYTLRLRYSGDVLPEVSEVFTDGSLRMASSVVTSFLVTFMMPSVVAIRRKSPTLSKVLPSGP